jgi:cell wall-associated NlpC family hydrolase
MAISTSADNLITISRKSEDAQRAKVVDAARGWIGTPYHHRAHIKGVGVDCALILVDVFTEAQIVSNVEVPAYSPTWHLHREEEKYTNFIRQFARETDRRPPKPGDIIVWKFHKAFAHGGIVTEWPYVVHALMGRGVYEDDVLANQMLAIVSERTATQGAPRPFKIFSFWPD